MGGRYEGMMMKGRKKGRKGYLAASAVTKLTSSPFLIAGEDSTAPLNKGLFLCLRAVNKATAPPIE